jgi:prevent-host-death family protein
VEVGIRELRNNLSALLGRVRRGEHVVVTDRGRPVARLSPVEEADAFARLVADGIIQPAAAPKRPAGTIRKVKASGSVSELVANQRR